MAQRNERAYLLSLGSPSHSSESSCHRELSIACISTSLFPPDLSLQWSKQTPSLFSTTSFPSIGSQNSLCPFYPSCLTPPSSYCHSHLHFWRRSEGSFKKVHPVMLLFQHPSKDFHCILNISNFWSTECCLILPWPASLCDSHMDHLLAPWTHPVPRSV